MGYCNNSVAFVKERFHNAIEIDILGIFGRSFIVTNLAPPKNYSGANSSGANDVIANRPYALPVSRFPPRVGAACLYVESVHLLFAFDVLACQILDCASLQTQTRPVLSGSEMTSFCYMTRSVFHNVHSYRKLTLSRKVPTNHRFRKP